MDRAEELKLVLEFIKHNPEVDAEGIGAFCEEHKCKVRDFSGVMYEIISSLIAEGESKGFQGKYAHTQMKMGIAVEMEHTTCSALAEKIAMDHLAEIPDYYTRLKIMEDRAKKGYVAPDPDWAPAPKNVDNDEGVSLNATEIAVGRLL